jgi:hypothetical protein
MLASSRRFALPGIEAAESGRFSEAQRRIQDAKAVATDTP